MQNGKAECKKEVSFEQSAKYLSCQATLYVLKVEWQMVKLSQLELFDYVQILTCAEILSF